MTSFFEYLYDSYLVNSINAQLLLVHKIRFDDAINCSPFDFDQRVGYPQSQIAFANEIWFKIIAAARPLNVKR